MLLVLGMEMADERSADRTAWGMGQKKGGKGNKRQKRRWGRSCFLNPKT